MKKILALVLSTCLVLGSAGMIFATTVKDEAQFKAQKTKVQTSKEEAEPLSDTGWLYWYGGYWRHGVGTKYVWSHYDHNKKTHKTSVKGKWGFVSSSGWVKKKKRASASYIKALWGNEAYATCK